MIHATNLDRLSKYKPNFRTLKNQRHRSPLPKFTHELAKSPYLAGLASLAWTQPLNRLQSLPNKILNESPKAAKSFFFSKKIPPSIP